METSPPSSGSHQDMGRSFDVSMHNAALAFLEVDDQGMILHVNEAGCTKLGREADALLGTPLHELFRDVTPAAFAESWADLLGQQQFRGLVFEVLHGAGHPLWLEFSGHSVVNESDGKTHLVIQIQELLPKIRGGLPSCNKLSAASCLDLADIAVMALNREGKIVKINQPCLAMMGYDSQDEVLGKVWFDLSVAASDREAAKSRFSRIEDAPNADRCGPIALKIHTRDNEERVVRWQCRVMRDYLGQFLGCLSSGHDITSQVQAEEALSRSRMDLSIDYSLTQIFLNTEDEVVFGDVVQLVTRALGARLGLVLWKGRKAATWLGSKAHGDDDDANLILDDQLLVIEDVRLQAEPWGNAISSATLQCVPNCTVCLGTPLGEPCTVLAVPVIHSGQVIGLLVVAGADVCMNDIAMNRLARYANQISPLLHGHLEQLAHETQRQDLEAQLRQSQKMEAIGELAGGIAHDFNNMLQIIMGNVQLARLKANDPAAVGGKLEQIGMAAERAASLVRRLLAFSRRQVLRLEPCDLNLAINEVVEMLQRMIGEQICLTFHPASSPAPVQIDREQFEQVLVNLCINARDAMPQGGSLDIHVAIIPTEALSKSDHDALEAQPGKQFVRIIVRDDGSGMTRDVREHAFDPFFTTKAFGTASGFGLSVAYGILRQHKGTITAQSEPGKGASLIMHLPLVEAAQEETVLPNQKGLHPKVLVVEDDAAVRSLACEILNSDYETLEAGDGEEAIALFSRHEQELALVLMDVVLPKLGGKQAVRQILMKRPDLGIIFTSGYSKRHVEAEMEGKPNIVFLQKPYLASELLSIARRLLERCNR